MSNTYKHIPDELLEKILLPQQVKSLLQWKCVCKSWNQVISRKSFIKAYGAHQKSSENTRRYFLLNYRDPNSWFQDVTSPFNFPRFDPCERGYCSSRYLSECSSYYSASLVDRKSYNVLESYNDICCRKPNKHCLEVYGICDGLLCLSVHQDLLNQNPPIFLYNPIIRKGKKLIPPPDPQRVFYPATGDTSMCFGCHDDDYKVIKVDAILDTYEVFIYSLNTDSWKFIKFEDVAGTSNDERTFVTWPYPKAKLVNGVAYFIQGNQVVCFDLSCEIIRKIQWSGGFGSDDHHIIMEEYGESIALIGSATSHNGSTGNGVVMWVLRQRENSYTWEKKFTLEAGRNYEVLPQPVPGLRGFYGQSCYPAVQAMGGFINKNELVMRRWTRTSDCPGYVHREYLLYNAENGFQQHIQAPEEETGEAFLQRINILTESLVLLTETTMPPIPSIEVARSACFYNKTRPKVGYDCFYNKTRPKVGYSPG